MRTKRIKTMTQRVAILAGALATASAFAGDVTWDRLVNSEKEPGNWLNHHGNLEAHRFSGLNQINKGNVKKLKVAWIHQPGEIAQGLLADFVSRTLGL